MHSTRLVIACCLLGAVGCGDNIHPELELRTQVANTNLVAGDRVFARCEIVDQRGNEALGPDGEPLVTQTTITIRFDHPSAFTTDDEGHVLAIKAGTATVRCTAPDLGLVDEEPIELTIAAGPPARVFTQLDRDVTRAGEAVGVTCLAFDAFDNPVTDFVHAVAVSPSGAGVTVGTDELTATLIGEYDVSCAVMGAAEVESALLQVVPALPASILVALSPERTFYAIDDQVTLVAEARDEFGNRVDDAVFAYGASPTVPSPSEARFEFDQDGSYELTATVISPTANGLPLVASRTVFVDTSGPAIDCLRADDPTTPAEAYMIQRAPGTMTLPVRISDQFDVQSVTIGGAPASFDAATGAFQAPVTVGFGMNFVDVVATDALGLENSTTCFFLAGQFFTAEDTSMDGSLGMRLDQRAIGGGPAGTLDNLNEILRVVLGSQQLKTLVDQGLRAANPINDGSCGFFACNPDVTYNSGTVNWNAPSSAMTLVSGGFRVNATLPNVRLSVDACGTTCCPGGSTIQVNASSIAATITFNLSLQAGKLHATLAGSPAVTVGTVDINGDGFCGFVIDVIKGFFEDTVRDAVRDALTKFINSNVGPLLDQLVSSLDISTLATSFAVPRLDGGTVDLGFGLRFSNLNITTTRALIEIGTRFTPGTVAHNRPSLGVARRTPSPLLDPPGTTTSRPVGLSLYEGILNQVLHGLWRGGYFTADLALGSGSATIDAQLPPVVAIAPGNTATLMLGGISATVTIPGFINTPIPIVFGGRASASVTLVGDELRFGGLTIDQLFVSFRTPLTQAQRTALADFLADVLQGVLADAINNGLPAFPIPSFELPDSVSQFGLPAGAELGITNPQLSASGSHYVLTGGFGVRN